MSFFGIYSSIIPIGECAFARLRWAMKTISANNLARGGPNAPLNSRLHVGSTAGR